MNMFNTVISDPVGLETNVSTCEDLLKLVERLKKQSKILDLLRRPCLVNNEVVLGTVKSSSYIGKTGTTKNGAKSFVGIDKNENPVILLGWK